MKVYNTSKNTLIGEKIEMAQNDSERRLGLIPKNHINDGEGLIIDPCNAIHMYYMKFPIDVLFVSRDNQVVYILENFKPWQRSGSIEGAEYVVELPVGTVQKSNTHVGDRIGIYK